MQPPASTTTSALTHKPSCLTRCCRQICCCCKGVVSGPLGIFAFFCTRLNVLGVVCGPLAFVSEANHWGAGPTFTLAMLAVIPLAERLGYLTEQLALHTNETLGGLLNATFGNAVETLISITALQKAQEALRAGDETEVSFFLTLIQTSLLGSMLSNLLLVQGSAFFVGGLKHSVQKFSRDGAITSAGLLVLCTMGLGVPSMTLNTQQETMPVAKQLTLSRFVSGCLLFIYFCFLVFQLKTHRFLFEGGSNKVHQAKLDNMLTFTAPHQPAIDEVVDEEMQHRRNPDDATSNDDLISDTGSEPEEVHAPDMGLVPALFWLALSTVCVAFISEVIVAAAQGAVEGLGISPLFIGGIVLPVVGNGARTPSLRAV